MGAIKNLCALFLSTLRFFFAYWPDLTSSPMLKLKPVRDLTEDGFKAYSEDYLLKLPGEIIRILRSFKAYSEDYLLK